MSKGAGSHLHDLIKGWTGEEPDFSCSCAAWIRKMDRDLEWTKKNVGMIVGKLRREAIRRKKKWKVSPQGSWWRVAMEVPGVVVFLKPFLRAMVNKAIKMAEQ